MGKVAINFKEGTIDQAEEEIIVGIDLGTTNSLVAYMDSGIARIIPDQVENTLLVPSVIFIDEENNILVGDAAKKQLSVQPNSTIYSVKRLLGKSFQEVANINSLTYQLKTEESSGAIKIKIREKYYDPIELSAMILSYLKKRAEQVLQKKIVKAVITVPSYFNDHQRQATRDAGKLAGLDVLRIVNEPTAASLAYDIGLNKQESKIIAVYDLGGGTFDISILRLEDGVFDVLSTHGDTALGGDDIDQAIISHWMQKYNLPKETSQIDRNRLRQLAEEAKICANGNALFQNEFNGVIVNLDSSELETVVLPFFERTMISCKNAIKDSKLKIEDIDEILLVGGSTRLEFIRKQLSQFFSKSVNTSLHPDHVVALGAAIQADILAGNNKDFLLIDVTPLSLGIETIGGLMDTIIARNSKVPISQARSYTTSIDGQKNLKIAIYQGERELVQHNFKLGEFTLKNIPPMPAGLPKIEIQFLIDPDGILKVKAKELRTNTVQEIEIKSMQKLSEEQMAMMLIDSIKNAQTDLSVRGLIEIKNEVNYLITNYNRFLKQNETILTQEEKSTINSCIEDLEKVKQSDDKDGIQSIVDHCNHLTEQIAHRIMDYSIQDALQGKGIADTNE